VEPPGDHQVQDQPEIFLQADGKALPHAPELLHGFALDSLQGRLRRAEQEGAHNPHAFQPLVENARLQGFEVNGNVRKFRHGPAILARGSATVNPRATREQPRAAETEKPWGKLVSARYHMVNISLDN
jgi:hypothetical protein